MSRLLLITLSAISIFVFGCSTKQKKKETFSMAISYTLKIDPRLKSSEAEYKAIITKSIGNIQAYAKNNGWEKLSNHQIIEIAEVVYDRKGLEKKVIEVFDLPKDTPMLPGLTAGNNSKDMLLIMPEEESKKYSAKYVEPGFYEKLITHELAHIFHILTLNGDEDKMGPIWFYEGFPVTVARQLESFKWSPSKEEAYNVMKEPKRGDYRQYGWMVRQLLKKHDMKTLVSKAGEKGFNEWAISQIF